MQIVVFELAGAPYALPVEAVREVLPYQEPRPLPAADPWDLGVVSVRGTILRVWDLGLRLRLASGAPGGLVVVEDEVPVALIVERIVGVQEVADELQPLPYFPDALGIAAAEQLVVVLDVERLVGDVEEAEEDDGLEELSKRELDRLAREAEIPGRSRMDRDELIAALRSRGL
jgi:chemotaxis signal transduction protein